MSQSKTLRPRKPAGRWVYYLLEQNVLWPCPVHWEWDASFGGWLPFYYSPSMEFIAGDPKLTQRVDKSLGRSSASEVVAELRAARRQQGWEDHH